MTEEVLCRDNFIKKSVVFAAATFLVSSSVIIYAYSGRDYQFSSKGFIWNCFLSAASLIIYCIFRFFYNKEKKLGAIFFLGLWILFLPNAFYMLTDLKYISQFDINAFSEPIFPEYFWKSWAFTFALVYTVLASVAFGFVAINDFEKTVLAKHSRIVKEIAVIIIMLLSGLGIYIGRFPRVNSWDILRPAWLLKEIIPYLNKEGMIFDLLFAYISWTIYMLIRGIIQVQARSN